MTPYETETETETCYQCSKSINIDNDDYYYECEEDTFLCEECDDVE